MDRFVTDTVLCIVCLTEQPVSSSCNNCSTEFALYFCAECRFFDNTPDKNIFHCDKCLVCRIGKGHGIDIFHCEKCDACIDMKSQSTHRCLNRSLHSNCPICRGYLFTSTETVVFMRCGHTMHSACFQEYTESRYKCPICMRSLTDTTNLSRQIDIMMESEVMPVEFRNRRSKISCNDCQTKSIVAYHFCYHKCSSSECGSYNTNLVEVVDSEEESVNDVLAGVQSSETQSAIIAASSSSGNTHERGQHN